MGHAALEAELAADLGPDPGSGGQGKGAVEQRQVHGLGAGEAGVDFDALAAGAVAGQMLHRGDIDAGAELPVHAREEVAGEGGGDAGGVVVGGLEHGAVLDQVDAEQEKIVRTEGGGEPPEKEIRIPRLEIADRAAEKDDHRRRGGAQQRKRFLVGAVDAEAMGAGVLPGDHPQGVTQGADADVDGNVAAAAVVGGAGPQQMPGLGRAAGAEFDQRHRTGAGQDVGGVALEDGGLGAGRVVLRLAGDLLVEGAAAGIVEKSAFELRRAAVEAAGDRYGKVPERVDPPAG